MAAAAKAPEAFRTISEVAEELDLPQHVLRFWETRFPQIKPLKRGGGRRYYRPDDVHLLRGIRRLLYGEGYTIKGVQKILRDQGLRHVASMGRDAGTPATAAGRPAAPVSGPQGPRPAGEPPPLSGPHLYAPPAERALQSGRASPAPSDFDDELSAGEDADFDAGMSDDDDVGGDIDMPGRFDDDEGSGSFRIGPEDRPAPTGPSREMRDRPAPVSRERRFAISLPSQRQAARAEPTLPPTPPRSVEAPPVRPPEVRAEDYADDIDADAFNADAFEEDVFGPEPEPVGPDTRGATPSFPLSYATPAAAAAVTPGASAQPQAARVQTPRLSDDDVRRLRGVLAELVECKRLLDRER